MKTNIFRLSILLVMVSFLFAGCDKNENDQQKDPEKGPITATVKYYIPDRYDLSTYTDMEVTYTDAEGKSVSEKISSSRWEKSISNAKVPGVYQLKVTYKRNSTPMDKENYKFGSGLTISTNRSDGKYQENGSSNSVTATKANAENYIANFTEEKISIELK